jgi:hypothetical protein
LESPFSIGMHFGTFQLTDEAIDEPVKALQAGLAANGIDGREFIVPRFGETIEVVPHGRAAAGP